MATFSHQRWPFLQVQIEIYKPNDRPDRISRRDRRLDIRHPTGNWPRIYSEYLTIFLYPTFPSEHPPFRLNEPEPPLPARAEPQQQHLTPRSSRQETEISLPPAHRKFISHYKPPSYFKLILINANLLIDSVTIVSLLPKSQFTTGSPRAKCDKVNQYLSKFLLFF